MGSPEHPGLSRTSWVLQNIKSSPYILTHRSVARITPVLRRHQQQLPLHCSLSTPSPALQAISAQLSVAKRIKVVQTASARRRVDSSSSLLALQTILGQLSVARRHQVVRTASAVMESPSPLHCSLTDHLGHLGHLSVAKTPDSPTSATTGMSPPLHQRSETMPAV